MKNLLKEPFPVGDIVDYGGEKLKVSAYHGQYVLLYKRGRNADFAVILAEATDNCQQIEVTVDDGNGGCTQEPRYIRAGGVECGIYRMIQVGEKDVLLPDHQFVPVAMTH